MELANLNEEAIQFVEAELVEQGIDPKPQLTHNMSSMIIQDPMPMTPDIPDIPEVKKSYSVAVTPLQSASMKEEVKA